MSVAGAPLGKLKCVAPERVGMALGEGEATSDLGVSVPSVSTLVVILELKIALHVRPQLVAVVK